jgi:tRNA U34 5-methylaminomethyl-2-thiouridine-forming methyltransferase MnmC
MDSLVRQLILTKDGSHSLYTPEYNQFYHSLHGAVEESLHIFIELGLRPMHSQRHGLPIRIFEMGLGTGLNALLTWQWCDEASRPVEYCTLEAYPVPMADIQQLNYGQMTSHEGLEVIHQAKWEEPVRLSPWFSLTKYHTTLQDYASQEKPFDIVYYDAFAPSAQPELWTADIFEKVASLMCSGGYLVTYCSKSIVQRALRSAGFVVEKHPGPWGKREVLRAVKP